jgi:hypothetical protein
VEAEVSVVVLSTTEGTIVVLSNGEDEEEEVEVEAMAVIVSIGIHPTATTATTEAEEEEEEVAAPTRATPSREPSAEEEESHYGKARGSNLTAETCRCTGSITETMSNVRLHLRLPRGILARRGNRRT